MSPIEFEYLMGLFLILEYDETKIGKGTIEENGKLLENLKILIPTWKLSNSIRKINGQVTEEDIGKALFEANLISTSGKESIDTNTATGKLMLTRENMLERHSNSKGEWSVQR